MKLLHPPGAAGRPTRRSDIGLLPSPTAGTYTNEVIEMNGDGTLSDGRGIQRGDWVISQATLREFKALAAHAKRLRVLRARLIELLEAGTPIQPGPLTVVITRHTARRLTKAKLSALIGADLVEAYLENVELSDSRRLDVREV